MNRWVWMAVVGVVGMPCGLMRGAEDGPTSGPVVAVEVDLEDAVPEAVFEGWVLSAEVYPEGVDDEAGYLAYVQGRVEAFLSASDRVTWPVQKVHYQLAAVNWMLARQLEPMVSRLALGIETPDDTAALLSGVGQAKSRLAACRLDLESVPPAEETKGDGDGVRVEVDGASVAQLKRSIDALSAFAAAIEAAWRVDDATQDDKSVRRAASALGVLLEDDRAEVAMLASWYRARVYGRMGRLERALSSLEPALAPLPAEGRAAGLYNRLLRCQLLARQGGYVVAWSLLLRLEERVNRWFSVEDQARQASLAVGLVRLDVARQWEERLRADGAEREADWCRRAAQKLEEALKQEEAGRQVLRLGRAVPMMMVEPDLVEGVPDADVPQLAPQE